MSKESILDSYISYLTLARKTVEKMAALMLANVMDNSQIVFQR